MVVVLLPIGLIFEGSRVDHWTSGVALTRLADDERCDCKILLDDVPIELILIGIRSATMCDRPLKKPGSRCDWSTDVDRVPSREHCSQCSAHGFSGRLSWTGVLGSQAAEACLRAGSRHNPEGSSRREAWLRGPRSVDWPRPVARHGQCSTVRQNPIEVGPSRSRTVSDAHLCGGEGGREAPPPFGREPEDWGGPRLAA